MATTSDLRKGMLIRYNGAIQRVIEYQHIAPGNWRAMVRMKLKNFDNGKITEDRVRAGDEIDIVQTETGKSRPHAFDEIAEVALNVRYYAKVALKLIAERKPRLRITVEES